MIRRNFLKFCGAILPVGLLGRLQASPQETDQKEVLTKRFSKMWNDVFNLHMRDPEQIMITTNTFVSVDSTKQLLYANAIWGYRYQAVISSLFGNWDLSLWASSATGFRLESPDFFIPLGKDIAHKSVWDNMPDILKKNLKEMEKILDEDNRVNNSWAKIARGESVDSLCG